jgi:hypothetical protein
MTITLRSDNLTKNLVKRTKLVQHLDKAFAKFDGPLEFKYTSKEKDDAWHPSGDCTPSVVELWNKAIATLDGEDHDPISGSLRKVFLVGHFWHEVLQHLLVEDLAFCEWKDIEVRGLKVWGRKDKDTLLPFHWATGFADVAPCNVPRYGPCVVDFKTMNSRWFKALKDRNVYPDSIDKWECQVNMYMDWHELDKALMVCVNKDSPHDFAEIEFRRNQPLIDVIYEKWQFISECLDDNDPPHVHEVEEFEERFALPLAGPVES